MKNAKKNYIAANTIIVIFTGSSTSDNINVPKPGITIFNIPLTILVILCIYIGTGNTVSKQSDAYFSICIKL